MKRFSSFSFHRAFTLVELLTVMAIIVVLLTIVVPVMSGVTMGSAVTRAGTQMEDTMNSARQHALAQQRETVIRLINCVDPADVGSPSKYRAMQVLERRESGTLVPYSGVSYLQNTMVMMDSQLYSSVLGGDDNSPKEKEYVANQDPKIPGVTSYRYRDITFRPNGATDLPSKTANYFITVASVRSATPTNFYTITVDPISSKVSSYRP